jgi:hypothetical protein
MNRSRLHGPRPGSARVAPRRFSAVALGCAALSCVGMGANLACAQQSYNGPIVGITGTEGRRWGWGVDSPATIVGFGAFGGWRFERFRVGFLEHNNWWEESHGMALDFGGFLSADIISFWLDPELSGAIFFRWEPAARVKLNQSLWALAPSAVLGVRAGGVEVGVSVTEEVWISAPPNRGNPAGANLQAKVGVDLFELVHLAQHLRAASDKPTP